MQILLATLFDAVLPKQDVAVCYSCSLRTDFEILLCTVDPHLPNTFRISEMVHFLWQSYGDNNVRGALSPGQSGQGCKPILRADMVLQTHPCTVVPDMPCILSPKHHGQGCNH